jgi:hypothetical protein
MAQRVKFIEKFPKQMELIFNDGSEYYAFFEKRFEEVSKELNLNNPSSKYNYRDWVHTSFKINKDGKPRKYYSAPQLQTKEARAKQKDQWGKYIENKRKLQEARRLQEQKLDDETYCKAIKILTENNVDLNRLNIRIKRS